MVWQVRENCHTSEIEQQNSEVSGSNPGAEKKISTASSNKLEFESRSSRGSSSSKSVDLGPTPGSGIVTTDASEASDNEFAAGNSNIRRDLSMGVEMTESMTTSSLMQFNRDVESMLEHGALRAAMQNTTE